MNKFLLWLLMLFVFFNKFQLNLTKDIDADEFAEKFHKLFKGYFDTGVEGDALKELRKEMIDAKNNSTKLIGFPSDANPRVCLKCYIFASSFIQLKKNGGSQEKVIKDFMKKLCAYADLDSEHVCNGEININFPVADFIFGNRPNLTASEVCTRIMPEFGCARYDDTYENTLTVEKPVLVGSRQYNFESNGNLTILHLSDFHYDQYYAPGSSSLCGDFVCCRGPVVESDSKPRAGYWGDYESCDSPGHLAENILQEIVKSGRKIDVIYFTGDFADHFSWNITRKHCENAILFITNLLKQYFPKTPVYPILGNHESYPANIYAPRYVEDQEISTKWLYEFIADQWKEWLTDEARVSLSRDGYYSLLIRPKLRLVAVNSNVANVDNLWLLYDEFYYKEQLQWLIDILENASISGEKVHIIGHIASNHLRCNRKWAKDMQKIVERYAHVIAGHFNGHSHLDEFVVYYASEDDKTALSVAWNGGSGTSFIGLNSNFKYIYVDDQTYEVLDFETWIFNLTEANAEPGNKPVWYKEYSFKSFFDVEDLSPASIDNLLKRFASDKELLRKYWEITNKQSDPTLSKGCSDECLQNTLDSITRTVFPKLNLYTGSEESVILVV